MSNKTFLTNPNLFFNHSHSYQHLDTEICSFSFLKDYLEWLKKENIYDNTQIFILSDHAEVDISNRLPRLLPLYFGHDVLFLFKDFKARGVLKTDSRLMGNFDAATIFCENLKNGCPQVAPNILKNYPENREIIHARTGDTSYVGHENNLWRIYTAFKIQGNDIYDPKNYIDVSSEYATADFKKTIN